MRKRLMILTGTVALVALLTLGIAAAAFAQTAGPTPNSGSGNYGPGSMMQGGGMMNGGGNGYGPGGMMGNNNSSNNGSSQPLTVDEAKNAATQYLSKLNNANFTIDEIIIFDNNAYVAIKDKSLGVGAFELLVNPATKTAFGEPGPNMMWNLLYGHMNGNYPDGSGNGMMGQGGMMGGSGNGNGMRNHGSAMMGGLATINPTTYQPGKMPVTAEQALKAAQTYLDKVYPGVKASATADEFPGYYTIDVETNGNVSGMLSVNGYSGQVWYHTWHGKFIQMADFG